jgi:hypothetical protein
MAEEDIKLRYNNAKTFAQEWIKGLVEAYKAGESDFFKLQRAIENTDENTVEQILKVELFRKQLNRERAKEEFAIIEESEIRKTNAYNKEIEDLKALPEQTDAVIKQIKAIEKQRDDEFKETQNRKKAILENTAKTEVQIADDTAKKIKALEEKQLQDRKNAVAQTLREINEIYQTFVNAELQLSAQRTDRILDDLEREREARLKQLELESKDIVTQSDIQQAQIDKINEEYDERRRAVEARQFEYEKQLKTAQTITNGIVGASQIVASQAANPVLLALSLAAIAATTAGQVATIQSQELPTFAEGGMVTGPGTGTSDSILARLSNGEFIVNAKATQQNLPLLTALNEGKMNNMMPNVDPELKQAIMQLNNNLSTPMKAYILQGDVTNSVKAEQQLKSRRKL